MLATSACASAFQQPPAPRTAAGLPNHIDGASGQVLQYCRVMREKGNLVIAAGLCERAYRLDPTNPQPLLTLAGVLTEMGELNLASEAYRRVLEVAPEDVSARAEAHYGLGRTYVALEQYDLALDEFRAAVEAKPDDPRLYNALGVANSLLGGYASAQAIFRNGLKIAPNDTALKSNLGLSLVMSGRYEEGLPLLEAAATAPDAGTLHRENLQFALGLASAARAEIALAEADSETVTQTPDNDADYQVPVAGIEATEVATLSAGESGLNPASIPGPDSEPGRDPGNDAPSNMPVTVTTVPLARVKPEEVGTNAEHSTEITVSTAPIPLTGPFDHADPPGPDTRPGKGASTAALASPSPATPGLQTARATPPELSDAGPPPYLEAEPGASTPVSEPEARDTAAQGPSAENPSPKEGRYAVQLASYTSAARAYTGWDILREEATDLLGGFAPQVVKADLGSRGVFYRLRLPPRSFAAADRLCGALSARQVECMVVRIDGDTSPTAAVARLPDTTTKPVHPAPSPTLDPDSQSAARPEDDFKSEPEDTPETIPEEVFENGWDEAPWPSEEEALRALDEQNDEEEQSRQSPPPSDPVALIPPQGADAEEPDTDPL